MLQIIIACLIAFACLCVFVFALRNDVRAGTGLSAPPRPHLEGLSASSDADSDLIFRAEDYRKLQTCRELKTVRQEFLRARRRIVVLWLKDLKRDVRVLWTFRRFLVSQGLHVTFREELAIAGLGCFAALYLNLATVVVFLAGPYRLARIPRRAKLPVELLAARGTSLLSSLPSETRLRVEQHWQEKISAVGFV